MKLHRFKSISIKKAYENYSAGNIIDSFNAVYFIFVLLLLFDILKLFMDDSSQLKPYWWVYLSAIGVVAVFAITKKVIAQKVSKLRSILSIIADLFFTVCYLSCIGAFHSFLFGNNFSGLATVVYVLELAIYHVLYNMVISKTWMNLISLLAINIMDIAIGVILYPDENKAWVVTVGVMIVAEIYIIYYHEIQRQKSFEKQFELLEKDRIWAELLSILPQAIIVLDPKRQIKYINRSFVMMFPELSNVHLRNVNQIPAERVILQLKDQPIVATFSKLMTRKNKEPVDQKMVLSVGAALNESRDMAELLDNIYKNWGAMTHAILDGAQTYLFYGSLETEDNEQIRLEIKLSMQTFDGRVSCMILISDITNKDMIRSLRKKMVEKDKMLASVSHELRTPLNGIINFIQSAVESDDASKDLKDSFLIPAVRSSKYLLTLINDILDMSQIQNHCLRLVPTVKSLVATAQEAMQLIEIQAIKKKLFVNLIKPSSRWDAYIMTDHNRLLQILANLLSNALKFTFNGGITIEITQESTRIYKICVQDTGIGIRDDQKEMLFREYGKLDLGKDNEINPQGVGLGLIVSYSLAKLLGPDQKIPKTATRIDDSYSIWFESQYGKGTKFFFRILDMSEPNKSSMNDSLSSFAFSVPSEGRKLLDHHPVSSHRYEYTARGRSSDLARDSTNQSEPGLCKCPQILVADDDSFSLAALENILQYLKFNIATCFNGRQALDEVNQRIMNPCSKHCRPFQMIFLDSNMPILDGFECASQLRQIFGENPEFKCPIIACTANAGTAEIKLAMEAGTDDYMVKPISKQNVIKLIQKYLGK